MELLTHPNARVHSWGEMIDGSVIAKLEIADMRIAIQYVLMYPSRRGNSLPPLDLKALGRLEFEEPDHRKFPCIGLAYEALRVGGTMPAVLNAANEVAVNAFLRGRIRFSEIAPLIERTMTAHKTIPANDLETVLHVDSEARIR